MTSGNLDKLVQHLHKFTSHHFMKTGQKLIFLYKNLLELLQFFPLIYHKFYCSLPHELCSGKRMCKQKIITGAADKGENAEETKVTSGHKFRLYLLNYYALLTKLFDRTLLYRNIYLF